MLDIATKEYISKKVQAILQSVSDDELPKGEISFILHIDGAEDWSWCNIRNQSDKSIEVPTALVKNLTYVKPEHVHNFKNSNHCSICGEIVF